jgi:hypothetical protein
VVDDDLSAPKPKPKPARPAPAPDADAFPDLELLDDEPAEPKRPAPKPSPKRPPVREPAEILEAVEEIEEAEVLDAAEVVEDDPPAARRRPRLAPDAGAYAEAPAPRRRPALAADDEDEDEDRPRRRVVDDEDEDERPRRRRPRGRRPARQKGGVAPVLLITVGVAAVLWLVLTPLAFFSKYVAICMLVVGFFPAVSGRIWLARIMHRETEWIHRIIPFYEFYFVLTRLGKTFAPLVLWACGLFFLASGGISLAIHRVHERNSGDGDWGGRADPQTRQEAQDVDARCEKLLAVPNRQEARAWLAALPNRPFAAVLSPQVEAAYQNGAAEVVAANIHVDADGDPAADLILVLPGDPASRQRVFAWRQAQGNEERDFGQKYLLLEGE